jgi:hypothetical protein
MINKEEAKLIRACVDSFKRTIEHIQGQIELLENRLGNNEQLGLFDKSVKEE